MVLVTDLGGKLKEIRKAKGFTLSDLAKKTGLSSAYLSNIERNQTSPTIDNLFKVGNALNIDLTAIMENTPVKQGFLIRKDDRKLLFASNANIIYESVAGENHNITGICITINANCSEEIVSTGHSSRDELGIVAKGSIAFFMNGAWHELNEGDSIFVERNTPHSYKRIGEGECISYWFYAKDRYDNQGSDA